MRVLKPTSYFFLSLMNGAPWGGSEELWYRTALFLAKNKQRVACAVFEWPEKEAKLTSLEKEGVVVFRLPNKKLVKGNFVQKNLGKRQAKTALKKTIADLPFNNYDITVINQGGLEIITNAWQDLYRQLPAYALLFHNYNEADVFTEGQKKKLKQWTDHAVKNLFAAAKAKEILQQQIGNELKNSTVFINPISFQLPSSFTSFPASQNKTCIFSVFAALDVARKAQDKLIQILATEKWKSRPWVLHLYGEGNDRKLLQQIIDKASLQNRVFLKGHTTHVQEAMRQSHLILQMTNVDAMPLSVVEAMAMSRPLVVSSIGDMPLWIEEGVNGWICKPDIKEIDKCLEKAWEQQNNWEKMGQRSFEIFQQKYPAHVEETFLNQITSG